MPGFAGNQQLTVFEGGGADGRRTSPSSRCNAICAAISRLQCHHGSSERGSTAAGLIITSQLWVAKGLGTSPPTRFYKAKRPGNNLLICFILKVLFKQLTALDVCVPLRRIHVHWWFVSLGWLKVRDDLILIPHLCSALAWRLINY